MRESIGGAWIFSIVITFIVLFSSYLAISINYSKAFKVKNSIVNMIEQNEGIDTDKIEAYLNAAGYYSYGVCPRNEDGREWHAESANTSSTKYRYCWSTTSSEAGGLKKNYYQIIVFFKVDLPVIGDLLTFRITGETKAVYFAKDN